MTLPLPGFAAFMVVTAFSGQTPMHPVFMIRTRRRRPLSLSAVFNAGFSLSLPSGPKPPPIFLLHLPQSSRTVDQVVGR
jgi:hypothetical protein